MKKLAVALALALMFGCASAPSDKKMAFSSDDFPSLQKQAKAAIKKAASAGSEWRDSKKILKKAKKAAKAGDMKKAMKLAKKAKEQGEMGKAQAMDQKKAGPWLF